VTLTLKPKGRGRWRTVTMQVVGSRAQPLLVKAGELITLGGIVFRICKVEA
jgi:hypothetical protein